MANVKVKASQAKWLIAQVLQGRTALKQLEDDFLDSDIVTSYAEIRGINPVEMVDQDYYWLKYGAPLWAVELVSAKAKLRPKQRAYFRSKVKELWDLVASYGIDGREFLSYLAGDGWPSQSARAMALAKWICQDGKGDMLLKVLWAMSQHTGGPENLADELWGVLMDVAASPAEGKKPDARFVRRHQGTPEWEHTLGKYNKRVFSARAARLYRKHYSLAGKRGLPGAGAGEGAGEGAGG